MPGPRARPCEAAASANLAPSAASARETCTAENPAAATLPRTTSRSGARDPSIQPSSVASHWIGFSAIRSRCGTSHLLAGWIGSKAGTCQAPIVLELEFLHDL